MGATLIGCSYSMKYQGRSRVVATVSWQLSGVYQESGVHITKQHGRCMRGRKKKTRQSDKEAASRGHRFVPIVFWNDHLNNNLLIFIFIFFFQRCCSPSLQVSLWTARIHYRIDALSAARIGLIHSGNQHILVVHRGCFSTSTTFGVAFMNRQLKNQVGRLDH